MHSSEQLFVKFNFEKNNVLSAETLDWVLCCKKKNLELEREREKETVKG